MLIQILSKALETSKYDTKTFSVSILPATDSWSVSAKCRHGALFLQTPCKGDITLSWSHHPLILFHSRIFKIENKTLTE